MNFVPCFSWVKRGIAKAVPEKLQVDQEELKKLIDELKIDYKESLEDEEPDDDDDCEKEEKEAAEVEDTTSVSAGGMAVGDEDDEDINTRYNLDDYDDDESEKNPIFNIAGLTVYGDSRDDPYITVPDEEDEEEEEADFKIKESDNLLVVGHVENDSSILEVYVYNEEDGDMYVHHDILLPAYPLAIEWLDYHSSEDKPGNYVAVSDMTPVISIWDLDVVGILEPYYKLGEKLKKKKKAKKARMMDIGHTDAVLDLSWNRNAQNVLASGSADASICLWDLQEAKCVSQMNFHTDKVQSLKWNPSDCQVLLSGGCDGTANLSDCRVPNTVCRQWSVDGEVERVLWNHFDCNYAFCSTDGGFIHCLDTRVDEVAYTIKAHNSAVTGLDLSSQYPGCLITASTDRTFKVWDVSSKPKFIASKKMKLGSIFVAKSNPDYPFTFAFGGDNRSLNLKVVDLMGISECSQHFSMSSAASSKSKNEKPVSVAGGSGFPVLSPGAIIGETELDMDTNINEFSLNGPGSTQSQKTNTFQLKKSKKKSKSKNKKKFA